MWIGTINRTGSAEILFGAQTTSAEFDEYIVPPHSPNAQPSQVDQILSPVANICCFSASYCSHNWGRIHYGHLDFLNMLFVNTCGSKVQLKAAAKAVLSRLPIGDLASSRSSPFSSNPAKLTIVVFLTPQAKPFPEALSAPALVSGDLGPNYAYKDYYGELKVLLGFVFPNITTLILTNLLPMWSSFSLGKPNFFLMGNIITYMKWMLIGLFPTPVFECLKRYLQTQGIFKALSHILLLVTPFGIILNYYLTLNPATTRQLWLLEGDGVSSLQHNFL
ncbi:hypothetical protein CONCODRAFT_3845 [Conidiobolus coronatus NRRL 28638]|uniref:Uncharacterized protein n=1 Tax=Conidiobolus coronatus (strain ATCC 28846 / CBS 209.66 / NRRL 28638) TaxID=796925 RepID=A0A137PE17_CONC2|nr:hypothetical protein CONCODRAFT_3845 [Conidiobolus coronatus NRRL 28638]|eukprot:KXN73181.1 hypothetical protein CONCODRAFT_3845 [Conidiobolus coronatus NRRL 28638]